MHYHEHSRVQCPSRICSDCRSMSVRGERKQRNRTVRLYRGAFRLDVLVHACFCPNLGKRRGESVEWKGGSKSVAIDRGWARRTSAIPKFARRNDVASSSPWEIQRFVASTVIEGDDTRNWRNGRWRDGGSTPNGMVTGTLHRLRTL